jgi:hypothetical protein
MNVSQGKPPEMISTYLLEHFEENTNANTYTGIQLVDRTTWLSRIQQKQDRLFCGTSDPGLYHPQWREKPSINDEDFESTFMAELENVSSYLYGSYIPRDVIDYSKTTSESKKTQRGELIRFSRLGKVPEEVTDLHQT